MELSLRVRSDMRYFFAIVVGSMMLGCTERNNQHVELRSGEAADASRLIKSLGGACTTRFEVASFCGRLHTASAKVTSKLERAEHADQYCRALLTSTCLGLLTIRIRWKFGAGVLLRRIF